MTDIELPSIAIEDGECKLTSTRVKLREDGEMPYIFTDAEGKLDWINALRFKDQGLDERTVRELIDLSRRNYRDYATEDLKSTYQFYLANQGAFNMKNVREHIIYRICVTEMENELERRGVDRWE